MNNKVIDNSVANKKIIIFGGGISGLTVASELLDKNFDVTLIEKNNVIGGMAKTRRENNNTPSEHSWRGFAPFYKNTFEILKKIPFKNNDIRSNGSNGSNGSNVSVYDTLSIPIDFYILRDNIASYKPDTSITDKLVQFYYGLKYYLSDKRKQVYDEIKLIPLIKNKLSKDGYDFLIEFISGPGYGMEKKDMSLGHFLQFPLLQLNTKQYLHTHNYKQQDKSVQTLHSSNKWHVMTGPTSEVWLEPWLKHLESKGLNVLFETELERFNINDGKISSCLVKTNQRIYKLKADDYVLAINPFNAERVLQKSNMDDLYNQHRLMNANTESKQISFRLGLDKNIVFPKDNIAFVMSDSEFNITWYPQEKHWTKNIKLDSNGIIKSLWSGTIIQSYGIGKLFNKKATNLSKSQLITEIKYQILRSKSFQQLIYDNNGFYLSAKDIIYDEIWYEWKRDGTELNSVDQKWANNIYNEKYRPVQQTKYNNLFLSGAHTKTSIKIWSMEGATESGLLTTNHILNKYNLEPAYYYEHKHSVLIKPFQKIDDGLYTLGLPNIIDVVLLVILCMIIYRVVFRKNKRAHKLLAKLRKILHVSG